MSKQFDKQNKTQQHNTGDDLQHLGFNGGQGGVEITEELIKELKKVTITITIGTLLQMVSSGVNNSKRNKLKNIRLKIKNLSNGLKNNLRLVSLSATIVLGKKFQGSARTLSEEPWILRLRRRR